MMNYLIEILYRYINIIVKYAVFAKFLMTFKIGTYFVIKYSYVINCCENTQNLSSQKFYKL